MQQRITTLLFALSIFFSASLGYAQLSVSSSGAKHLTLNDRINKNQFVWVSEAPLENIKGSAEGVTGAFTIDPANLTAMRGSLSVQSKTMKTGNATRDNHLLSSEWIDANKYQSISFNIVSIGNVKPAGNTATATATGDFTLHGVTRRMAVPFKLTYLSENDKTRQRAPGDLVMIAADFTIALKDFNVKGTEGMVGSKVGEIIKINAQLFGNTN